MRRAACCLVLVACGFHGGGTVAPDARAVPDGLVRAPWWDPAYRQRRRLVVTTGAVHPDKGYAGYTARLAPVDLSTFTGLDSTCNDLRVVGYDGAAWRELPRHLIGCGTAAADLRFALPVELADNAAWYDAYVYYGRPAPLAPASATGTSVYRWWDDARGDRSADHVRGRMDAWLGTNHLDSIRYDLAGYYTYDTGDNGQDSFRRAVDERDVLVETEWFHTGCYANNMQTSVCARGVIASGTGATEQADHYYCSSRAHNPACNDADQGIYDGDIVKTDNETIALQGLRDPPPIVPGQWRKQALAVFGAAPTQLRFWDADASWPALAAPPATAIQATGADPADHQQRGFAGVMLVQDIGRFRGVVIRRYVEPEPLAVFLDEEAAN